ncbi:MAG: hypothetical protein A2342_09485 [Gallionellales bacterium RIFOXYB12_FULL_54_9]|nr:MAG: hypothetical protein A2342_09485 [Gallionellales bacterium RIFOXYB12_FULL_54_9]
MAKDRSKPISEITFYCKPCYQSFKAEPGRVEDAPEQEHHPFAYFADCPRCGDECEQVPWERNLLKAYSKATGPKTDEGKAATAANLDGHPTPEEALRTRFNAMKHGLNARTATYFPAKPDGYSFCEQCDIDRVHCSRQSACVKKTELFMLHHAAFEQRNPKHLVGIYADLQASIFAVIQQILQTIVSDGVKIEAPQYYVDKETNKLIIAEYVDEKGERRIIKDIEAHPLFRPLGEMLSRANLSLSDMGMTQKAIEAEESDLGRLTHDQEKQESIDEYRNRTMTLLAGMAEKVQRANQMTNSDLKLIEYQQEGGDK